ncbi:MAG: fibronectin type III domain-containing protein [Chloroflexota bacterium]|nr:fibronectin type III domain-containing protein [Chloroflexota bacterium]
MSGRLVHWARAWPARRVALAVVAGVLLVSAAWLGGQGPVGAQEAEAEGEAEPKNVAEVRISGLRGTLTYGGSDGFTVTASNLTTVVGYDVIVSRNNGALGIGACGTGSQTQRVSGVTSQNLSFTVHGCAAGSGTVTAVVRRTGLTTNEDADSQTVTVPARAPQAPARPTAPNPKAREFTAQWQAPGDTGGTALTGYHVLMRPNGATWPPDRDATKVGATTRRQRFSGLTPNRIYWFKVKACNGANQTRCSGWSPQASVTLPIGTPGKPTWGNVATKPTEITVHWSAPGDTGGVGLTGYGLRHWQKGGTEPSSAQVVVTARTSDRTFGGLAPNTTYRFSIQACNGTNRCSGWTNKDGRTKPTPTPTPTPPEPTKPGRVGRPAVRARDAALHVDWDAPRDGGSTISHHDLRYRAGTSGSWTQTRVPPTATETVPTDMTVSSLSNGTAYQVQVRACNAQGCGAWSGTATGTPSVAPGEPPVTPPPDTTPPPPMCTSLPASPPPVPSSLDAPTNLDLTPALTTRHAQLAWAPVSGAAKYKVEIRRLEQGRWGAWGAPDLSGSSSNSGEVTNATCYDIKLDHIVQMLSDRGLANSTRGLGTNVAFGFQVKAINGVRESDFSNEVIVIDFSRAYANGDSRGYPVDGQGQAEISWQRADQVLGSDYSSGQYSFRYRELRHRSGPGAGVLIHHSDPDWQPNAYVTIDSTTDNPKTGLTLGTIYGVQIRLDNTGPGGTTSVYAARDIYAWPHHESTYYRRHVVATHDFRLVPISRATSREAIVYRYRICTDTFTFPTYMTPGSSTTYKAGDPTQWVPYINHALRQWQYATNGLVQMIHEVDENGDSLPCSDTLEFLTLIAKEYNYRKGKGETESDIDTHIASFLKMLKEEGIKGRRLGKALAKDLQLSEILMIDDVSGPIATLKDRVFNNVSEHVGIPRCPAGCAVAEEHVDPERPLGRPIRTADIYLKRSSHWSESHTLLDMRGVEQIRLNTCPGTDPNNDREHYHKPYATLVHESGHALGLWHPTNLGPVMSYTSGVPRCSPHPFDVLALMALYQSRGERRV